MQPLPVKFSLPQLKKKNQTVTVAYGYTHNIALCDKEQKKLFKNVVTILLPAKSKLLMVYTQRYSVKIGVIVDVNAS